MIIDVKLFHVQTRRSHTHRYTQTHTQQRTQRHVRIVATRNTGHTNRHTHTHTYTQHIDTRLRSRSHFIRICAYLLARACQSIKSGTQRYAQATDGETDGRTNRRATSKRFERYVYLFYVFLHSLGSAGTIASFWRDLVLRFARAFSLPNPSFFHPLISLSLQLLLSLLDPPFRFSLRSLYIHGSINCYLDEYLYAASSNERTVRNCVEKWCERGRRRE